MHGPLNVKFVNSVSTLLTAYRALIFGTRHRKHSSSLLKVWQVGNVFIHPQMAKRCYFTPFLVSYGYHSIQFLLQYVPRGPLGRVHTKLTKINRKKHKQNRNSTKTKVKLLSTHTPDKTQTYARCFSVLFCPHSADSCSEVNTSCGASRKMKNTYAWLRLALYSSHQKYQKKKSEAFLGEINTE